MTSIDCKAIFNLQQQIINSKHLTAEQKLKMLADSISATLGEDKKSDKQVDWQLRFQYPIYKFWKVGFYFMGNTNILNTDVVCQIGIIVRDIHATAKKYAEFFGIETPECNWTDGFDKAQTEYMGEKSEARAMLAFIHMKNGIDIELIQPDEHPSTWREYLDSHGEGVHHIAFNIKDMQGTVKRLAEINMPLVQKGEYTGGRYAYIDATGDLKTILELLEND